MYMEDKSEQFGSLRLKYGTIQELKQLKIATEASLKKELTNDEFVKILMQKATGNKD